jgi:hypothetical protein
VLEVGAQDVVPVLDLLEGGVELAVQLLGDTRAERGPFANNGFSPAVPGLVREMNRRQAYNATRFVFAPATRNGYPRLSRRTTTSSLGFAPSPESE